MSEVTKKRREIGRIWSKYVAFQNERSALLQPARKQSSGQSRQPDVRSTWQVWRVCTSRHCTRPADRWPHCVHRTKRIAEQQNVSIRAGFIWLNSVASGGSCEHVNEPSGSTRGSHFLTSGRTPVDAMFPRCVPSHSTHVIVPKESRSVRAADLLNGHAFGTFLSPSQQVY